MKQLHDTQLAILKKLLFAESLQYKDLKPDPKMENNKFQFHLDTMVETGFINKVNGKYELTNDGKEYAGRIDTEGAVKVIKQAKIGAFVCPIRTTKDGDTEVLMYTRLKHPFYKSQGFMSGKIEYGESITLGANRELKEETGLDADTEVVAIRHYLTKNKHDEIVEDKLIFWCRALEPTGDLVPNIEGDFFWVNIKEIDMVVKKPFETIEVLLEQVKIYTEFNGTINFQEIIEVNESF